MRRLTRQITCCRGDKKSHLPIGNSMRGSRRLPKTLCSLEGGQKKLPGDEPGR